MDIITLAIAKKYTDESLIGGGAIAGKNCTISSITDITGGKRVTFSWTLDNGTEKTGTMDVMNGINGINGADGEDAPTITGVTLNNDNSLTITMSDGTHYDTTPIPTVKGDNGYSPSATVTRVTDGIVLTVRDKTGTSQAKVDDGFSPIVTMHRNAANTGVELTITDINGSQTQTINDGSATATVDYANVTSKPEINGVEVSGDKTLAEYGINIPTKNSQLTNDSGYITEADLPTVDTTLSSVSNNPISNKAVTDEIRATQSTLNDTISDVDANTSAISILNGNATVNGSVDKKISDALANLDRLTKQIVSELPPVSSAVENVIYLIPNPSGTAYEQWTIVDDGQGGKEYALLGSTDTDLTGYYTSAQTDSLLNDKQATITGAASSVTSLNLTANKVVVSDSNGKVAASSITTTELEALDDITGNVQSQLDGKQATLTYDLVPTDNSTNMVKSGGIKSALDEKQNVLTFDNTPTVNSNNPVKSGGVYTALEGKNEKFQYAELPIASVDLLGKIYMYTGATTSSLTNGSFYKCVLNPDTATYEWKEQSSGEENVQADWTETDDTADSYIKHKPTLGTASAKNATDVIRPNNHNLAESGSVYNAIIGAVSSVYQQREPIAFSGLTSSLLIPENVGTVYKTTTSGTTTDDFMQGPGIPVKVNESIGIIKAGENTILFNLMGETMDLHDFQTKALANTVEGATTVEGALGALSTNKQSKTLTSAIEGATTVEGALGALNEEKMSYADNGILGAKNLIFNQKAGHSGTYNGITYTFNYDGSVSLNGTASTNTYIYLWDANIWTNEKFKAGSYKASASLNKSSETTVYFGADKRSASSYIVQYFNIGVNSTVPVEKEFNSDGDYYISYWVNIRSGNTVDNVKIYPMLRYASDTDTTYQPYAMTNQQITNVIPSDVSASNKLVTHQTPYNSFTLNNNSGSQKWYKLGTYVSGNNTARLDFVSARVDGQMFESSVRISGIGTNANYVSWIGENGCEVSTISIKVDTDRNLYVKMNSYSAVEIRVYGVFTLDIVEQSSEPSGTQIVIEKLVTESDLTSSVPIMQYTFENGNSIVLNMSSTQYRKVCIYNATEYYEFVVHEWGATPRYHWIVGTALPSTITASYLGYRLTLSSTAQYRIVIEAPDGRDAIVSYT